MTSKKFRQTSDSAQSIENSARRSLLNGLWLTLSGLALAEIAWLVGSFLKPLKSNGSSSPSGKIIDAGPADRFAPNTVTAFPRGRFYLACLEDGGFLALSRRCTHLGCTVPWNPEKGQFACPCHASVFVPPCKLAKPLMASVFTPSLYVGVPSRSHVLATFSPVSVPPLPVSTAIPSKPKLISASVPAKPSTSEPVSVTASIAVP